MMFHYNVVMCHNCPVAQESHVSPQQNVKEACVEVCVDALPLQSSDISQHSQVSQRQNVSPSEASSGKCKETLNSSNHIGKVKSPNSVDVWSQKNNFSFQVLNSKRNRKETAKSVEFRQQGRKKRGVMDGLTTNIT